MLGDLLYEEKGETTGLRVLSSEGGEVKVEVSLQAEGQIHGVSETSLWTYWSKTRSDGTIYGEGTGFMTTADGAVINLKGTGAAKSAGPDGSVSYRGTIYFHTSSEKFASLNGAVGVHEYEVDAEGNVTIGCGTARAWTQIRSTKFRVIWTLRRL